MGFSAPVKLYILYAKRVQLIQNSIIDSKVFNWIEINIIADFEEVKSGEVGN